MKKILGFSTVILSILLINSCQKDKPAPPVVSTIAVTEISTTTAVSGGNVTDAGGASVISRGVCWNTSDNPVITNNKTTESGGSGSFTSNITNLSPNTTYYVRAYATNSAGTSYGSSVSFKTLGDKPASSAANASAILTTSATLNGTVNPNSLSTTVTFEYGLTTAYGSTSAASQSPVSGDSNGNVTTALTRLNPGKLYHIRIKAENSLGITYSEDMTFTTLGQLPSVTSQAATNIQLNGVTLNATVNPNYLSTTAVFEWGISSTYGNSISFGQNPLTGSTPMNISAELTGLTAGTTYHYRIRGDNNIGISVGGDMTFKTLGGPPSIVVLTATNLQYNTATINGTVNPNYFSTSFEFEWGPTVSYGNTITPLQSPVTGNTLVNISANLSGLSQGVEYHYRIKATNELGSVVSNDMTFTTLSPITDIDGNVYGILSIGTQVWMAENLKTTKYRNGDPIPNITDSLIWNHLSTGAYCDYDNNSNNSIVYGKLYNWYAVNDDRKLCPTDWHPATPSEWVTLLTFAGWDNNTGGKLKETGTAHWYSPNTGATNEYGFTALPGGYRYPEGSKDLQVAGCWWVAKNPLYTEDSVTSLYLWNTRSDFTFLGSNVVDKVNGHSVRCLKD